MDESFLTARDVSDVDVKIADRPDARRTNDVCEPPPVGRYRDVAEAPPGCQAAQPVAFSSAQVEELEGLLARRLRLRVVDTADHGDQATIWRTRRLDRHIPQPRPPPPAFHVVSGERGTAGQVVDQQQRVFQIGRAHV